MGLILVGVMTIVVLLFFLNPPKSRGAYITGDLAAMILAIHCLRQNGRLWPGTKIFFREVKPSTYYTEPKRMEISLRPLTDTPPPIDLAIREIRAEEFSFHMKILNSGYVSRVRYARHPDLDEVYLKVDRPLRYWPCYCRVEGMWGLRAEMFWKLSHMNRLRYAEGKLVVRDD